MTATAPNLDPDIGTWPDDQLLAELAITREACEREPDPFAARTYELRARKLELQRKLAIRNHLETERLDALELAIVKILELEGDVAQRQRMLASAAKAQGARADRIAALETALREALNGWQAVVTGSRYGDPLPDIASLRVVLDAGTPECVARAAAEDAIIAEIAHAPPRTPKGAR